MLAKFFASLHDWNADGDVRTPGRELPSYVRAWNEIMNL